MANAEKLLHEAQYAFNSITFGESLGNKRNTARAISLCKKIIRSYPGTMEAEESHAILRRLGEEAYHSRMPSQHRHKTQAEHHDAVLTTTVPTLGGTKSRESLDWSGLISLVMTLPKAILGVLLLGGFFLFGIFGYFLFLPLLAFIFFTPPFRGLMGPDQRSQIEEFIVRANAYIDERRKSGGFTA